MCDRVGCSQVLDDLDEDKSQTITKKEFDSLITKRRVVEALQLVGVDVVNLISLSDFLFEDRGANSPDGKEGASLSFGDFIEMVLSAEW